MGQSISTVAEGIRRIDASMSDLVIVGNSNRHDSSGVIKANLGAAAVDFEIALAKRAVLYLGSVEDQVQHG